MVDREMSMRAFKEAFSGRASSPCLALINFSKFTVKGILFALLLTVMGHHYAQAFESTSALTLASLTDPAKLATLKGERVANPRLQKCVYWLAYAEEQGEKTEVVLDESAKLNKTTGTAYAGFVRWGLLENLKIAKELGLLTPEGMAELRRGKSATITKGQYAGQEAEADHVIPRAVCPELQNQVMNLELLPASLNRAKSDKVTDRAKVFAKELYEAKLLSEEGWNKVQLEAEDLKVGEFVRVKLPDRVILGELVVVYSGFIVVKVEEDTSKEVPITEKIMILKNKIQGIKRLSPQK